MCRIVSLFLLQRLKGSMSGDARDFNNIETRAVIKVSFFLQGKVPKEFHAILRETFEEHAPSYATVKKWVTHFNVVINPPDLRLLLDDTKQWLPRRYWSISRANLGRPPNFGLINNWATGHLTWAGWVHHSGRFGHMEVLREVGPEKPERGSKTSMVTVA